LERAAASRDYDQDGAVEAAMYGLISSFGNLACTPRIISWV
jgi:hypothetical protein